MSADLAEIAADAGGPAEAVSYQPAAGGAPVTCAAILERAGIPASLPSGEADPGILVARNGQLRAATRSFITAVGRHRHFERDSDPPMV